MRNGSKDPVLPTPTKRAITMLFGRIMYLNKLRTDGELADLLCIDNAMLSRARHKPEVGVGPKMILAMHEKGGMEVKEIRRILALKDDENL